MPRPKTKSELLTASADGFEALNASLDAFTAAQQKTSFPFEHRDKNIRDVLAHLHEWHMMMVCWYQTGMSGSQPDMPAKDYTWKTTPALNDKIWKKYQKTSLKRIRKKLAESHDALHHIIASHTNSQLFVKRHYSWTGTTSLGSYLTSATSSHYDWAIRILRRFERALQEADG